MSIMSLFNSLPGAVAQGLVWGIMAIGVYLTFRILDFADLTVDGSLCTGGAVCIVMMLADRMSGWLFYVPLWQGWQQDSAQVSFIPLWESRLFFPVS